MALTSPFSNYMDRASSAQPILGRLVQARLPQGNGALVGHLLHQPHLLLIKAVVALVHQPQVPSTPSLSPMGRASTVTRPRFGLGMRKQNFGAVLN
jgi:hypothetical protein